MEDSVEPAPLLPGEVLRTGTVEVHLPPEQALDLFTAEGERRWVPDWQPRHVTPPDGAPVEGGIFLTRDDDTEVIWRVQRFDRSAGLAEYLRVVPGNRVAVVTVRCTPAGASTRAVVSYRITPLSAAGRDYAAGLDEAAYAAMMRTWQTLIEECLDAEQRGS
jgi:hypothetical protein